MYVNKQLVINKLIEYLKKELLIDYKNYKIVDKDGNTADLLVRNDSMIFEKEILGKEYIKFNVEELIDKRMFDNKDEIVLVDFNSDEEITDLDYLQNSLDYYYLSYSDCIKKILNMFVNYVISRNNK